MVLAIIFANVWGAIELTILGSFARTVRVRTVLLAVAAGLYACGPIALLLQYSWTYLFVSVTGGSHGQLVTTASYTIDPFIEEVVKVLPVLALLRIASVRRQWSLTDCILVAAAAGAGFGLAENLFAVSGSADKAYATDQGWSLATDLSLPQITGFRYAMGSWLPRAVAPFNSSVPVPWVNLHLAWSAIGGLGVGLICLDRRLASRIAGGLLMLYISVDHATVNFAINTGDVVAPFEAIRAWLRWMPVVALAFAWWLDRARQRAVDTDVTLAAETDASPRIVGTVRAAISQPPSSLFSVFEFVRLRRAYYTAQHGGVAETVGFRTVIEERRHRLDEALEGDGRLLGLPSPRGMWTALMRSLRSPATILAIVSVSPALLWLGVGGWPQTASLQDAMMTGIWWTLVRLASIGAMVLLVWRVVTQLGWWPQAMQVVTGDDAAAFGLRFAVAAGGCSFLAVALTRTLAGADPWAPVFVLHILESDPTNGMWNVMGGPAASMPPFAGGEGSSPPPPRKNHQDPERPRKQPDPEKQQEPQDPERMSRRDREEAKRAAKKDADSGWKEAQKYKDAVDRANRKAAEAKDLEDRAARARREQSAADAEAKDHAERAGRKFDAAGDAENAELARQRANEADRVSKESADRAERIERPGSGKRQGEADRQPQQKPEQKPQETKPPNALDAQRKQTKAAASQSADAIAETNYAFAINVGLPVYIAPGGGTLAAGYLPVALAGYAAETHFANLAGDPPRDDFPSVSKYSPASDTSVTVSDFQSALHAYAVGGEGLCAALHALVTSLERHDGVRLALEGEKGSAMYSTADLRTFDRLQRDAIAHNARVSSAFVDRLVSNRGPLNAGYLSSIPTSEGDQTSPGAVDKGARRTQLEELWRLGKADIQRRFFLSDIDIAKIETTWHQSLARADDARAQAGALLDEKWDATMQAMSVELLRLADVYESAAPLST